LRIFIEHPDQNLKYLGLVALNNVMKVNPRGVLEHRDLILNCLEDEDETIRRRAVELVAAMVDKKNLAFIVDKLKYHMEQAEGLYKDELLEKIVTICSQDKYKFITDFEWYLGFLMELTKVKGVQNGRVISEQILDVCIRVRVIRPIASSMALELLEEGSLASENPSMNGMCEALYAAAWIVGEYTETCSNPVHVIQCLLIPDTLNLAEHIQSLYLSSVLKLLALAGAQGGKVALADSLAVIKQQLPAYMSSLHIEVQERACLLNQVVALLEDPEIDAAQVCAELRTSVEEVLNPVSPQAIFRVKVPEGLDLDAWIFEPMPEESSSMHYDELWPEGDYGDHHGHGFGGGSLSSLTGGYDPNDQWGDHPSSHGGGSTYIQMSEADIQQAAIARRAARKGDMYYLEDDDPPPVLPLEQHVRLPSDLNLDDPTAGRGRRGGLRGGLRGGARRGGGGGGAMQSLFQRQIRNQRPMEAVEVIEEDEMPEGWEEVEAQRQRQQQQAQQQQLAAAGGRSGSDALAQIVIDKSADQEQLPQRTHRTTVPYSAPPSGNGAPRGGGAGRARGNGQRGGAVRGVLGEVLPEEVLPEEDQRPVE